MTSKANKWLTSLALDLGLGELDFASSGIVKIEFAGDLALTLENSPADDALLLTLPLHWISPDSLAQGALFETLLAANHIAANPHGLVIALDPSDDDELLLAARISALENRDYEYFLTTIKGFIAQAQEIRQLISSPTTALPCPATPSSGSAMPFDPRLLA